jgi:hypothetical protein
MAIAACASSQQPRRALGRVARRSLVRLGTCFAASKRVERSTSGTRIVRARAPFVAARIVGRASRFGGAARSARGFFAELSAGATCFDPALQQLLEPSFCVVGCRAALASASVPEREPWLDTDTETSTLTLGTETSTIPPCTFTETLGMPTLT